jgi:hypothetical protein
MRSTWKLARPETAKWPKAVFGTGEMWGFVEAYVDLQAT